MKNNNNEEVSKLIEVSSAFKQTSDLIKAEKILKKALKIEPNNFIVLNNLGNIYSAKNDLLKANIFFSKAIIVKKNYSNAIFNLALTNEEIKMWQPNYIKVQ